MLHRLVSLCAAGTLLVLGIPTAAAPPAADIAGHYRIARSGMVVAVADCGDGRWCARIAALGRLAATDARNPRPTEQSRPLCGMMVMSGAVADDGAWQGTFYDPQVGGDYAISLALRHNGALSVRAHSQPPFLMRTYVRDEVWERVAPPDAPCGAPTPTS
jgi:uncharacterized protein (DUF2147 family)